MCARNLPNPRSLNRLRRMGAQLNPRIQLPDRVVGRDGRERPSWPFPPGRRPA